MKEIKPVPYIPQEIQFAADDANLVLFVGAGVSQLMGSPGWGDFADSVLNQLVKLELITFADVEQLSHIDSKKKLSIALNIDPDIRHLIDFDSIIKPQKEETSSQIYDLIGRIGCSYVTTNYDDYIYNNTPLTVGFDSLLEFKEHHVFAEFEKFKLDSLSKSKSVFHLHGSLDDASTMIISTSDYLTHYSQPRVQQFLAELFSKRTVVFVGYGVDELEILEFILKGYIQTDKSKHFMLQGYYSHQKKTYEHLSKYYRETFGIEVLPFLLDLKKYHQLTGVFADWVPRINVGERKLADDYAWVMEAADE